MARPVNAAGLNGGGGSSSPGTSVGPAPNYTRHPCPAQAVVLLWSPAARFPDPAAVRSSAHAPRPRRRRPAGLSIIDTSDPTLPALPDGHTFVGVWGIHMPTPPSIAVDLTVFGTYDRARVRTRQGRKTRLRAVGFDGKNGESRRATSPGRGRGHT